MRFARLTIAALVAGWLAPCMAFGADSTPTSTPVPPSTSDDRIALSANGSTLPGTNGGGGGSVGWLHNFDADTLAGVAVEHQVISVAHWTFGSVNGSLTRELGTLVIASTARRTRAPATMVRMPSNIRSWRPD